MRDKYYQNKPRLMNNIEGNKTHWVLNFKIWALIGRASWLEVCQDQKSKTHHLQDLKTCAYHRSRIVSRNLPWRRPLCNWHVPTHHSQLSVFSSVMNSWQGKRCRYEFGANYWLELFRARKSCNGRTDRCDMSSRLKRSKQYSETTKETIISYWWEVYIK